jgi:acyl carrier protein
MMHSPRNLVHSVVAAYVQIDQELVLDESLLEHDLGLDALDLVLLIVRLDDAVPGVRRTPISALASARTVADLVALVEPLADRDTLDMSAGDSA